MMGKLCVFIAATYRYRSHNRCPMVERPPPTSERSCAVDLRLRTVPHILKNPHQVTLLNLFTDASECLSVG
jgi:hypothetical protein